MRMRVYLPVLLAVMLFSKLTDSTSSTPNTQVQGTLFKLVLHMLTSLLKDAIATEKNILAKAEEEEQEQGEKDLEIAEAEVRHPSG